MNIENEDQETPYCINCGSEDLAHLGLYANGDEWKCCNCGDEFMWRELND